MSVAPGPRAPAVASGAARRPGRAAGLGLATVLASGALGAALGLLGAPPRPGPAPVPPAAERAPAARPAIPVRVLLVAARPEPEALVQILDGSGGGALRSVRPGDRLAGLTVVAVDARGLTIVAGDRHVLLAAGLATGGRPARPRSGS